MQLGVFSFGDNSVDATTGKMHPTETAVSNMLERAKLADEVGLDYFGVGEHRRIRGLERPANVHQGAQLGSRAPHLRVALRQWLKTATLPLAIKRCRARQGEPTEPTGARRKFVRAHSGLQPNWPMPHRQ